MGKNKKIKIIKKVTTPPRTSRRKPEVPPESKLRARLKLIGMIGSAIVFIIGTTFGVLTYLDNHNDERYAVAAEYVPMPEYRAHKSTSDFSRDMLAFNAQQAFIDTQYMVNRRELRWMDQMPKKDMSKGDKRHYKYLQESQQDLENRRLRMREEENKMKPNG
jgi:hypothetical protein